MTVRPALRLAALACTAVAVVGPLGAQASAQVPYPPSGGGSISDVQPQPGEQVTVIARTGEFRAGERVEVGVESTYTKVTTVTANSRGGATATFALPATLEAGNHSAVLTGLTSGNVLRIGFTIAGPASVVSSTSDLPTTGASSTLPLTVSGVGLSVVGLGIVVAARRRRTGVTAL